MIRTGILKSRRFWFWVAGLLFLTASWSFSAWQGCGVAKIDRISSAERSRSLCIQGGCVAFREAKVRGHNSCWGPPFGSTGWVMGDPAVDWPEIKWGGHGLDLWPEFRTEVQFKRGIEEVEARGIQFPLWPLPFAWLVLWLVWMRFRHKKEPSFSVSSI